MKSFVVFLSIIVLFNSCSQPKNKSEEEYTDFERGWSYYYYKNYDSAFYMLTQYVNTGKDSLKKGTAYRYMGDIQWETGDLPGAEESATGAIKIFNENDSSQRIELMYTYHLLGNIRQDMKEYDDAIAMYNKAIDYSIDSNFITEMMNGKALAYHRKGEYAKAIALYDSILLQKPNNQLLIARAIDNRTEARWLQNPEYPALPEYWEALKIRLDSQVNRALNASYARLANYYELSNPDSALWYATRRLEQAQMIQSPGDRIEAMDILIRLADPSKSKYWYVEFKRLSDSFQLSKDSARKLYALIKYDSQKSNADNLQLKERITKQRIWIFSVVAATLLILLIIAFLYQKRKKRLKQETENAIRDANLKTSRKVHDVVANGLYGIMNELEHGKELERERLLTRIEDLYEQSRNISYEHPTPLQDAAYNTQVRNILNAFANEQRKIFVVGNEAAFWEKMSDTQKEQLKYILQELMVNMKKHSGATNVSILFSQEQEQYRVTYKDDGKGFTEGFQNGNGLNNTVNRINSLQGAINFGKSEKGGAMIELRFPL